MMIMLMIKMIDKENWNTTNERLIPEAETWFVKFPLITLIALKADK
jgi:hypothetical protein